ncbi:pyruvate dehydrogenase (acetyl-transferring), homodimeric type [Larkinella sp. GY13]|uniref:pyruvate dehydrogenase (acetyl-transferring), homodimeric type n=1 Tax=Larkinella sp. GY13 TaxID=3453720 RepID=UPI003EEA5652
MLSTIETVAEDWQLEKQEWIESIDAVLDEYGEEKTKELLKAINHYVIRRGVAFQGENINTPYINTINVKDEPTYPGNVELEQKIENINRWNAMCMVLQGYDNGSGVGGHIATYASAATMYEVGFHHFFRRRTADYGGDLVSFQPHAAPGIYARAFLEGRLTEESLKSFRRELKPGGGLPSYPHPRRMPWFWEMPCASMGLMPVGAIYQARFNKYLINRGLKPDNGGKVWAFIGDGEMDEPEIVGTINIAARERLDNLIFVVNCNLQRLDGPVRGNGKIIQELERLFLGAGWNVIKVIWSGEWDALLARDHKGYLVKRMEEVLDGDYQRYSVLEGDKVRSHWVGENQELADLMRSLTDEEIRSIKRGGHDYKKVYAAFHKAVNHSNGKPTIVFVKTIKGYGMGSTGEGRNTTHQKKSMLAEERLTAANRFGIPLPKADIESARFYKPDENGPEVKYLQAQRAALGGDLPAREENCPPISTPDQTFFAEFLEGTGDRTVSTTMVLVRVITKLLKEPEIGKYIVPIIPDEARTFGMDALFRHAGIYHPEGQRYISVDADSLSNYREAQDGQILQEGICEAGALASFMAAGSAYARHSLPMIPFYIFYSMFGFQRVGDMIWACGDMMCKGFLFGGTAGRTTLNGEGVQHQDGHSHLFANTVPNLRSYDPAFAYELSVIIRDGIYRMFEQQEKIFYYITVYNENYPQPVMPTQVEDGIIRGMYKAGSTELKPEKTDAENRKVHLMGSGSIITQVLEARDLLEQMGIPTDIWSVTSYNELARDGFEAERWNRLHPNQEARIPYVQSLTADEKGIFISVSDYQKSLGGSISAWMPTPYTVLGTDGYGLSEARPELRDYFEISPRFIVQTALYELEKTGTIPMQLVLDFMKNEGIDGEKVNPATA